MNQPLTAVTGKPLERSAARSQRCCAKGGLEACLIVRHASPAPGLAQDVAVTGYADRATAIEALTGVDILFMVSAAESEDCLEQLSRTLLPVNGATTVSPMTSPAQSLHYGGGGSDYHRGDGP